MIRATTIEEIAPLAALCRAGRLFDVQEWVAQGKPVALPEGVGPKGTHRNPLRVAMDRGFHSLVQVLLEAGAPHREGNYNALDHAVSLRRPDLAALLLQDGARVTEVSVRFVMDMWQPEMVELFISHGADLNRGNPIAWALIHKMRPALGLLKRYSDTNPGMKKQAEIALRFHAHEGSAKWVSLLLWAGADPWACGPDNVEDREDKEDDDSGHLHAIELAIITGKLEVLKLKNFITPPNPGRPETMTLIEQAGHAPSCEVLSLLLERGHRPDMLADKGTAAINAILFSMSWDIQTRDSFAWGGTRGEGGLDSYRSREQLKLLHMLVASGAKWLPGERRMITDARRCLLKMTPDYLLEFAWLMRAYRAARRRDVEELLRPPSVARLLGSDREKGNQIVAGIPDDPSVAGVSDGGGAEPLAHA